MTLIVRPEVHEDILQGAQWYESREPGLGVDFVNEVDAAIARILAGPTRYAKAYRGFRRTPVRRFPYAVCRKRPKYHYLRGPAPKARASGRPQSHGLTAPTI
jgi:hypothetical protein